MSKKYGWNISDYESALTKSEQALEAADKQIGWLKGDKDRLDKSIKIRDRAMDSLMTIEDSASKKLTQSEAENKRLREENIDLQHGINTGADRYTRLYEASRKLRKAVLRHCNPPYTCIEVDLLKSSMLSCFAIAVGQENKIKQALKPEQEKMP